MAVILYRSEEEKAFTASPEQRKLPSIVVQRKPVSTGSSHVGKKISARCAWQYGCAEPPREEVWRSCHDRRKVQLSSCGFYGPAHKPYQDVGEVTLDDEQLILDGLGQAKLQEKEMEPHVETPPAAIQETAAVYSQLRAKTPSQFPTDLVALESRVREGNQQLEVIRRGRGLFMLLADTEQKQLERVRLRQADVEGQRNEWQAADIHSSSVSLAESDSHMRPCSETSLDESSQPHSESQDTSRDTSALVEQWYRQLCALLWVLQAMRMESVDHMIPLSECWRVNNTAPSEQAGKRHTDLQKHLLQKWEHTIQKKQVRGRWATSYRKVSTTAMCISRLCTPQKPSSTSTPPDHFTPKLTVSPSGNQSPTPAQDTVKQRNHKKLTNDPQSVTQRKLTPAQMENLLTLLEEELNWSKKQSRCRIKALVKQADEARLMKLPAAQPAAGKCLRLPKVSLDVSQVEKQFADTEEELEMIVHEQLSAMDRERVKALQQRFSSLNMSGNKTRDLAMMRQGVEIESTTMAKRKLLMNYNWYEELVSELPAAVHSERYCVQRLVKLREMASYMASVVPEKMSRKKLIAVLSTLRPWELHSPPVKSAVQFITDRVIYIVREDYDYWLKQHSLAKAKVVLE